jgi:cellulose synthase/poly-beta-1,6-N-acetylglucosamine synthase-like glycosyltransferase
MLEKLESRKVKLSWLGPLPDKSNKVALLIPQYNEGSNGSLELRLDYFSCIAEEFRNILDIVIIDDGSTDGSLNTIKSYKEWNPNSFYVSLISPNSNKVGALYLTVLSIDHEFVILSDFDTDLRGLREICKSMKILSDDPCLMGCYFRMLPFEGFGSVFLFQQLEYAMARTLYRFHQRERSVPVMPGAGCCYKREALKNIYSAHSGLRSGEDRESTLLGLKLGYKTFYSDEILCLTRPPLSFRSLIKQRIRWNLGYIETFSKEKKYYYLQIKKFSRIGIRTIMDFISVKLIVLLPIIIMIGLIASWKLLLIYLVCFYFAFVLWSLNTLMIAPNESYEFRGKRVYSILYYPFYKILLDYIAWTGAILVFIRKR